MVLVLDGRGIRDKVELDISLSEFNMNEKCRIAVPVGSCTELDWIH
jgi:hypothetical protein